MYGGLLLPQMRKFLNFNKMLFIFLIITTKK